MEKDILGSKTTATDFKRKMKKKTFSFRRYLLMPKKFEQF